MFRALIEHADRQLVLAARAGKGGQGIQLRGTRPFHFKTVFGTVAVDRIRVTHRGDGPQPRSPSAAAWGTAHRCEITRGLREAICDQMLDESAGAARQDVGEAAGEPDLVCRSTVLDVVHEEGAALLGAVRAGPTRRSQAPERPAAPAGEAAGPPVVVELDEVKVKAQPQTGRKEVWLFTAVVRLAGWCHLLVDCVQEGLTRQLAALLRRLGVTAGRRPLRGDGRRGGVDPRPGSRPWRCRARRWCCAGTTCGSGATRRSAARGCPRPRRSRCWAGCSVRCGRGRSTRRCRRCARPAARRARPGWIDELIGYLEARRPYLADYKARKEAGQPLASHRVEKWNDWAVSERCKGRGMSWTAEGVVALAVLEAARRNGELDAWRRDRKLPPLKVPRPPRKAA